MVDMDLEKAVREKVIMDAATKIVLEMSEEDLKPILLHSIVKALDGLVDSYRIREIIDKLLVERAMEIFGEPEIQAKIEEKARLLAVTYVEKVFGPAFERLEWAAKVNVSEKKR